MMEESLAKEEEAEEWLLDDAPMIMT
jgi:hypothetical protein